MLSPSSLHAIHTSYILFCVCVYRVFAPVRALFVRYHLWTFAFLLVSLRRCAYFCFYDDADFDAVVRICRTVDTYFSELQYSHSNRLNQFLLLLLKKPSSLIHSLFSCFCFKSQDL